MEEDVHSLHSYTSTLIAIEGGIGANKLKQAEQFAALWGCTQSRTNNVQLHNVIRTRHVHCTQNRTEVNRRTRAAMEGSRPELTTLATRATHLQWVSMMSETPPSKPSSPCGSCGLPAREICGRCKGVSYCDKKCQKAAWRAHKANCAAPADGSPPVDPVAVATAAAAKANRAVFDTVRGVGKQTEEEVRESFITAIESSSEIIKPLFNMTEHVDGPYDPQVGARVLWCALTVLPWSATVRYIVAKRPYPFPKFDEMMDMFVKINVLPSILPLELGVRELSCMYSVALAALVTRPDIHAVRAGHFPSMAAQTFKDSAATRPFRIHLIGCRWRIEGMINFALLAELLQRDCLGPGATPLDHPPLLNRKIEIYLIGPELGQSQLGPEHMEAMGNFARCCKHGVTVFTCPDTYDTSTTSAADFFPADLNVILNGGVDCHFGDWDTSLALLISSGIPTVITGYVTAQTPPPPHSPLARSS